MAGIVDAVFVPLVNTVALGGPKFARFRRLKNSARNCKVTFSEIFVPLVNTVALGGPKFARFRRLKNSARNCKVTFSEIDAFLNTDTSRVARPGPVSVPLPRLP